MSVSTDATTGNLKELKADCIEVLDWSKGRRSTERTRGGDAAARNVALPPNPYLRLACDPNTDTDRSLRVLNAGEGPFAFKVEFTDGTTNGKQACEGLAKIDDLGGQFDNNTQLNRFQVELKSAGTAWTWTP